MGKVWTCECGDTHVVQRGSEAHIYGQGWVREYYEVRCRNCTSRKRIGLKPVHETEPQPFNYDPELFKRLSKSQQEEVLGRPEVKNKEELSEHTTRRRTSKGHSRNTKGTLWRFVD